MTEKHRAGVERVREVAEKLGSPGQDVTPDKRDGDATDPLQDEIRRRRATDDDESPDRDG